jgi:hypothetical protein
MFRRIGWGLMQRHGYPLWACSVLALASAAEAGETVAYSYDSLGRLVRVDHSGTVNSGVIARYSYDSADNRTNVTVNAAAPPPPPSPPPPPPSNHPPVAVSDSFQVQRCASAALHALANDSDPDGDALILTSVGGPAAQVGLMGIANNRLSWSPSSSSGTFTGAYTISDGRGGTATGGFTVQLGPGGC